MCNWCWQVRRVDRTNEEDWEMLMERVRVKGGEAGSRVLDHRQAGKKVVDGRAPGADERSARESSMSIRIELKKGSFERTSSSLTFQQLQP